MSKTATTVSNAVFVAYAYTTDGWDAGHAVTLTNGTTVPHASATHIVAIL